MALESRRLGLVLSAGGLRGAAHLGVFKRLIDAHIPIDVIVGSSAGAMVGAMYAAVGQSIEEIIEDAPRLRGRHVLVHSLVRRAPGASGRWLQPYAGIVPERLSQLAGATFDTLHHGVRAFGVVCYDLAARRPMYFSSANTHGLGLPAVVRASGAVPFLFPPGCYEVEGREVRLTDGGIGDPIPSAFAREPGLDATHLVVSDCRGLARPLIPDGRAIYVRPALTGLGMLRSSRSGLMDAVRAGEAAVTDAMIDRVRAWLQ